MLYFSKKVVHPETRYLRWIMTRWQTEENNYHSFWFMQVMLHFNSSNSKEFLFISFQSKNNYYYSIMCILKHYSLILWYIVIYKRISKKARKIMITLICWIFACYWSWTFLIIRPIHAKLKCFFFSNCYWKGWRTHWCHIIFIFLINSAAAFSGFRTCAVHNDPGSQSPVWTI